MFKTAFAFPKKSTARLLVAVTVAAALGLPGALFAGVLFLTPLIQQPMLDAFVREQLGHDPASWGGTQVVYALAFVITAFVLFNFGAIFGGIFSWLERRVAGRMQSRIGPNRVGAAGFLQWLADAVKLLFKEDLVPAEADALLFRIAPYFVVTGFALTLVALPFGQSLIMADLGVGIFYITSVTALVVVGILLSGWSSNSKWALFGGMRSAAQVISYEIPAGLAIMTPVLMAGTLSMQGIIRAQGGWPWEWFLFRNPAALVAFFILFASQLAEGNRTPFDLPEAESELVAGYMTEYSGFRFALFFLVEWGNLWVMSAIAVTLFLGGWQLPGVPAAQWAAWRGAAGFPPALWWGMQLVSLLWFSAKTLTLVGVVMWIRWTLPRIRVDQMMNLCWKYLVPAAFACFLFTLLWQLLVGSAPAVESVTGVVLFAAGVLALALFARQTRENIALVAGDKVDLSNW
ncbi:MAG TPA: NADH-quinone oxidoreductase subunit NuoH [Anaeromyxobacteraceae bacterium]|nr:NADH-quinone oxidoreductase subunit NuoH [Anaeromyxobacteraceae bacterium]